MKRLDIRIDCPECGGCGARECHRCAGTGIGQHGDPDTSGCTYCDGGVEREACSQCEGTGTLDPEQVADWAMGNRRIRSDRDTVEILADLIKDMVGKQ